MLKFTAPLLLVLASSELFASPVLFTAAEYAVDVVDGVLDVLLVGNAFAESGRASNLATAALSLNVVALVNNVPEAPTFALLLVGLLIVTASWRVTNAGSGSVGKRQRIT